MPFFVLCLIYSFCLKCLCECLIIYFSLQYAYSILIFFWQFKQWKNLTPSASVIENDPLCSFFSIHLFSLDITISIVSVLFLSIEVDGCTETFLFLLSAIFDFIWGPRTSLFFLKSFSHSSKNEEDVDSKLSRMVNFFSGIFSNNPNIFPLSCTCYLFDHIYYKVEHFFSLFFFSQIQNPIRITVPGKFHNFHYVADILSQSSFGISMSLKVFFIFVTIYFNRFTLLTWNCSLFGALNITYQVDYIILHCFIIRISPKQHQNT